MAHFIKKPKNQISREEYDKLIADLRSGRLTQMKVLEKLGLEERKSLIPSDEEQFIIGLLFYMIRIGKLEGSEDKGYNPNEGRQLWEPPVY